MGFGEAERGWKRCFDALIRNVQAVVKVVQFNPSLDELTTVAQDLPSGSNCILECPKEGPIRCCYVLKEIVFATWLQDSDDLFEYLSGVVHRAQQMCPDYRICGACRKW